MSEVSGDSREGLFIFQRLSVTIQRLNAALFHESFSSLGTRTRSFSHSTFAFNLFLCFYKVNPN